MSTLDFTRLRIAERKRRRRPEQRELYVMGWLAMVVSQTAFMVVQVTRGRWFYLIMLPLEPLLFHLFRENLRRTRRDARRGHVWPVTRAEWLGLAAMVWVQAALWGLMAVT